MTISSRNFAAMLARASPDVRRLNKIGDGIAPKRLAKIGGVFRSKLERSYADHLAFRMRAGEIDGYWYEPWSFQLCDRRKYRPDFLVEFSDGRREWHEVKGYCWARDSLRYDWFVHEYPGETLVIVTRDKGEWIHTVRKP